MVVGCAPCCYKYTYLASAPIPTYSIGSTSALLSNMRSESNHGHTEEHSKVVEHSKVGDQVTPKSTVLSIGAGLPFQFR